MKKILSNYATVKAVLNDQKKLFSNNQINDLLIADKHQTAIIEIGENSYAIRTKTNGTQAHTNNYIFKGMRKENLINDPDSIKRLQRINYLLKHTKKPLTMHDFIQMSYDHNAGPVDSIFRLFTMATWIIEIPKQGYLKLYVRFTNPYLNYDVFHVTVDKHFWGNNGILTSQQYGILSKKNLLIQKKLMKSLQMKKPVVSN